MFVKFIFYSISILLFVIPLHSQNINEADSLELVLQNTKDLSDKIDILIELTESYFDFEPQKAVKTALKAKSIAEEHDLEQDYPRVLNNLAKAYFYASDYKRAIEYAEKVEKIINNREDLQEALARSYGILGYVYFQLGDYDKSSDYHFKTLHVAETIENIDIIWFVLNQMGRICLIQGDYTKAFEYYFRSFELAEGIKDSILMGMTLSSLGNVCSRQEKYEEAKKYYHESININQKYGKQQSLGTVIMNLACGINRQLGELDTAIIQLNQALSIFEKYDDIINILYCYHNLCAIYFDKNELNKSLFYAKKVYSISTEKQLKRQRYLSALALQEIYQEYNNIDSAYKYAMIRFEMKDSLAIEENKIKLSKLELQYELNIKEQETLIKTQRRNYIITIVIISLIVVVVLIVLRYLKQRLKAKNILLEKQQLELELNTKNKELTVNVLHLIRRNEILSQISVKLIQVQKEAVKNETKHAIKKIESDIKKMQKSKNVWEEFEMRFLQVNTNFYQNLTKEFPELTSNDLRVCALLKLNMSSKEISDITGLKVSTIEMARSRIRKKLGISKTKTNLVTLLSQY